MDLPAPPPHRQIFDVPLAYLEQASEYVSRAMVHVLAADLPLLAARRTRPPRFRRSFTI